jgi:hypothetical protein
VPLSRFPADAAYGDLLNLLLSGKNVADRNALEIQASTQTTALFVYAAAGRVLAAIRTLRRFSGEKRTTLRANLLAITRHSGATLMERVPSRKAVSLEPTDCAD